MNAACLFFFYIIILGKRGDTALSETPEPKLIPVWITDCGKEKPFHMKTLTFHPGETENRVINLYPELCDQTFEGFGGALTEALWTSRSGTTST